MNYKEIINSIQNKDLQPVYFLMGNEPFYIDRLANEFSKNVLSDEEKELNQVIFYAKDVSIEEVINESKQFPFGSKKRIVILKEAQ